MTRVVNGVRHPSLRDTLDRRNCISFTMKLYPNRVSVPCRAFLSLLQFSHCTKACDDCTFFVVFVHAVLVSLHEYQARHWTPEPGNNWFKTHSCLKYTARQEAAELVKIPQSIAAHHNELSVSAHRQNAGGAFCDGNCSQKPAVDEDFFVHRDYLYFEREKQFLVVNVNNTHCQIFTHACNSCIQRRGHRRKDASHL